MLAMLVLLVSLGVAVVGWIGCLVTPFRESAVYGAMCVLIPFYILYYLLTRWEEMRKWFLMYIGGIVMIFASSLVMTSVNDRMKADRAPRGGPNAAPGFAAPGQPGDQD